MKIKEIVKTFSKEPSPESMEKANARTFGQDDSEEEYKEETALTKSLVDNNNIIVSANKDIETTNYMINNPVSFY